MDFDQTFITFIKTARKACFIALALTGVTFVVGLFAATATLGPQCAGVKFMNGYRPSDLVGMTLPAGAGTLWCWVIGWCTRPKREEMRRALEYFDFTIFELGSIRISLIYCFIAPTGISGLFAAKALASCVEVLTHCQLLGAPQ